jgi:hypothetical protein
LIDLAAHGRHLVLVTPAAQETDIFLACSIFGGDFIHVAFQGMLGRERGRQVQLFIVTEIFRYVRVKVVDLGSPDFLQHLIFDFGSGIGDVGIGSFVSFFHLILLDRIILSSGEILLHPQIEVNKLGTGYVFTYFL